MGFVNQVKVTVKLLNCRLQPSMSAKIFGTIKMDEVHNIVAEQDGWGQLENGSWINLKFTAPYENKHEETVEIPKVFVTGTNVIEEATPILEVKKDITEVATTRTKQYKVKNKNESLWDIAELFYGKGNGARYVEIKRINRLKSDILRVGMILEIPNV